MQPVKAALAELWLHASTFVSGLPAGPVHDLLAGALLLAERVSYPAPSQLTVRNKWNKPIYVYAFEDGDPVSGAFVFRTELQPGQQWSDTASNKWYGGLPDIILDHYIWITTGKIPEPIPEPFPVPWIRIRAGNPISTIPRFVVETCPDYNNCQGNEDNNYYFYVNQKSTWSNTVKDGSYNATGWFWRGPDIDSGKWYKPNIVQLEAEIWSIS